MMDLKAAAEIISTYRKHGWVLRRVLSTDLEEGAKLAAAIDLADVAVAPSAIDAAWFSRPPKAGPTAWEVRYLGKTPFALLESLMEDDPDFEFLLSKTEARLRETISAKEAS
jgi:hypothetical protein